MFGRYFGLEISRVSEVEASKSSSLNFQQEVSLYEHSVGATWSQSSQSSSSFRRASLAQVNVDASDTSSSFEAKICGNGAATTLLVAGTAASKLAWPSCTYGFTNITELSVLVTNTPPVLGYLPSSLTSIALFGQSKLAFTSDDLWNLYKSTLKQLSINSCPSFEGASLPGSSGEAASIPLLTYSASSSGFSGSLPSNFFTSMPNLQLFNVGGNLNLQGDIPAIGSLASIQVFQAPSNNFSSWSSSSFTEASFPSSLTSIDMSSNPNFKRFIDDEWLQKMPLSSVKLSNLPSYIGGSTISSSTTSTTSAGSSSTSTTTTTTTTTTWRQVNMPSFFSQAMVEETSSVIRRTLRLTTLDLSHTPFFGPLPAWPISSSLPLVVANARFAYDVSSTEAYGPLPLVWQNVSFSALSLNNLKNLSGGLLDWHLKSNTTLERLDLRNTSLTGPMLDLNLYPSLNTINLDGTRLDYCSAKFEPRTASTSTTGVVLMSCVLDATACPCLSSLYPLCSTPVNCDEYQEEEPSSPTLSSPTLSSPTLSSPTISSPPSSPPPSIPPSTPPSSPSCSSSPPSSSFTCINGTWSFIGTVEEPRLVIAPNSPVVIAGNLSISDAITFKGLNSSVTVSQCVNATLIEIELTAEDLEEIFSKKGHQLTVLLLSSGSSPSSCASNLSQVQISLKEDAASSNKKGCKKASVRPSSSSSASGASLSAVFTINNDKCNTWWIVLVSVIVGVIVIAFVVIALLAALVPSFRKLIRPFSAKRATTVA